MRKFTNCNIIEVLEDIMRHNTERFQGDFEYDKQTITEAAYSYYKSDKNLIWISRRNGTHCFSEREAYVKDTYAHNTALFYGKPTREPIVAFAVEITGFKDGYPNGNLYELDLYEYSKSIEDKALPAYHILLFYPDDISTIPYERTWGVKIFETEKLKRAILLPADLKLWDETVKAIQEERRQNTYYSEWDISKLQNNFTKTKITDMEM